MCIVERIYFDKYVFGKRLNVFYILVIFLLSVVGEKLLYLLGFV